MHNNTIVPQDGHQNGKLHGTLAEALGLAGQKAILLHRDDATTGLDTPPATAPARLNGRPQRVPTKPQDGESFQRLFELFGCSFGANHGRQAQAEECPFCGGTKLYLNIETGQYKCFSGSCGQSGNAYTFINWVHETRFAATTDQLYHPLKHKRGLPVQTLRRNGLAWDSGLRCWLIPYRSPEGKVQNMTRYYLDTGRKLVLPGLPWWLYGLDRLSSDTGRTLFVCEGAFDAIALDHHLTAKKTRTRYDVLAAPSANIFKEDWLRYLKGRTVRLCFDKDKAGRDGQERIAKLCRDKKVECDLSALQWPEGFPDKCDIGDLVREGENVVEFTREHCVKVAAAERRLLFTRGDAIAEEQVEWMDAGHIPFGTFVSLSGLMGTHKSGIARDIVARGTAGLPMPGSHKAVPPFDVMYFTSEDSQSRVRDLVRVHGGDLSRLLVHDIATGSEPVDLLDCLGEMEAEIRAAGVRLVVIDALNSFVGGDISTDAKARRTLSGRLQALARRTGACIIGIRNWGRADGGSSSQRSLGAVSLSDVARCVMNTRELPPIDPDDKTEPRRFALEFEKVSDAPKPQPIPYTVKDLHTCEADSHLRRIIWGKPVDPTVDPKKILGRKKGSAKR